jgi:hypothetical protein
MSAPVMVARSQAIRALESGIWRACPRIVPLTGDGASAAGSPLLAMEIYAGPTSIYSIVTYYGSSPAGRDVEDFMIVQRAGIRLRALGAAVPPL